MSAPATRLMDSPPTNGAPNAQDANADWAARDARALGELVEQAEKQQDRAERVRIDSLSNLIISISSFAIFVISILIFMQFLVGPWPDHNNYTLISAAFSVLSFFGFGAYFYLWTERRKTLRREKRALKEVLSVIYEVYEATRPHLSPVEAVDIKVRLSRLDPLS